MILTVNTIVQEHYVEMQLQGNPLVETDFNPINEAVENAIHDGQVHLILNMQKVDLLNSIGINTLIRIFTKCRNNGGEMYIVNISDKINQVLLLTKLNTVLNIATSVEEAAEKMNLN
jgi:anti-sigma B factor antagonist